MEVLNEKQQGAMREFMKSIGDVNIAQAISITRKVLAMMSSKLDKTKQAHQYRFGVVEEVIGIERLDAVTDYINKMPPANEVPQ